MICGDLHKTPKKELIELVVCLQRPLKTSGRWLRPPSMDRERCFSATLSLPPPDSQVSGQLWNIRSKNGGIQEAEEPGSPRGRRAAGGGRRRWTDEQKARVVAVSFAPDALARKAAEQTHRKIAAALRISSSCVPVFVKRERETGSLKPRIYLIVQYIVRTDPRLEHIKVRVRS